MWELENNLHCLEEFELFIKCKLNNNANFSNTIHIVSQHAHYFSCSTLTSPASLLLLRSCLEVSAMLPDGRSAIVF